jgi:predicted GIY-YIG superfamily endonuclease
MFWVHVLENPRGMFYVGQTENLAERLQDHNRTDCFEGHFTRKMDRGNSFGGEA